MHLRIGRMLIERMDQKQITESIFDVVNQLNRAADLIEDPAERLSLVRLNVVAGMKARAAIAYASARNYFAVAEALLSQDAWDHRYQETFDLYFAFSECEYLVGNFAAADKLFDLILGRAVSNLDRAKVYGLRMKLYQVAGKYDDGVTVALDALRLFGVTFPESDEEIQVTAEAELADVSINLQGRPISELVESPLADDPTVQAIINLLVEAMPCAYIGRPRLFSLITSKAVNFSLRYASLQGRTRDPLSFDDGVFSEETCFAAIVKATFGCGIVFYRIMQQLLAFIHGRYTEALEAAALAEPMLGAAMAMPIEATYHFCHALTLTALYPAAAPAQQAEYRRILGDKLNKLQLWGRELSRELSQSPSASIGGGRSH